MNTYFVHKWNAINEYKTQIGKFDVARASKIGHTNHVNNNEGKVIVRISLIFIFGKQLAHSQNSN